MGLYGAAAKYIANVFGGLYEEDDGTVSVGTAATKIVGNDPDALALTIINLSANTIYLRPSNNPSATKGIQIDANGGSVSMNVRDDLTLPTRAWWALATAAASDVYYVRVRRYNQGESQPANPSGG